MMKSTCDNCYGPKDVHDYANPLCGACQSLRNEAIHHHRTEHPEAPESDALYAGRQALLQRSGRPSMNYIDPRTFNGVKRGNPPPAPSMAGMIPVPPQADRGNPNQ